MLGVQDVGTLLQENKEKNIEKNKIGRRTS
jgi:hypothetical protein